MRSTARLPARSANRRQSTHSAGTGSRYLLISDRTPAPTADAGSGARAAAGAWYALAVLLLMYVSVRRHSRPQRNGYGDLCTAVTASTGWQNMAKLVALMKIRPDISLAAAQSLYEEEHVPLVMNLMPMIREYRRNYLTPSGAASTGWPDFDVITELWFDSTADLESFVRQMRQGEVGRRLRADSARFLVAGTTRLFVVDERRIDSARELAR